MTALTANRVFAEKDLSLTGYPIADNVVIYHGAMVCLDGTGHAVPAADTAGYSPVVGWANNKYDNTVTGHSLGALTVQVRSQRAFDINGVGLTAAQVGQVMYVLDDNTVGNEGGVVRNFIPAGVLVEYDTATTGKLFVGSPAGQNQPTPYEQSLAVRASTAIAAGDLLYVSSWNATDGLPVVAIADADLQDARAQWVARSAIASGADGVVYKTMNLTGQNTNGFTVGDPMYLTTTGTTTNTLTHTRPTAGNAIAQIVGRVTVVSATVGQVEIAITEATQIGTNELQSGLTITNLVVSGTLTSSGGVASINHSSNFNTVINDGTSTGTITIGNSAAGALVMASGAASSLTVTGANLTLATATSGHVLLSPFDFTQLAAGTDLLPASGIATTAVAGFTYIVAAAGAFTGTPTNKANSMAPMGLDTTDGRLYMYDNVEGAWDYISETAGFTIPKRSALPVIAGQAGLYEEQRDRFDETICPLCHQPMRPMERLCLIGDRYYGDGGLHAYTAHVTCPAAPAGPTTAAAA